MSNLGLISDLKGAQAMVGQAQEKCVTSSGLWKGLGKMYDELEDLIQDVAAGEYDKEVL